MAKQVDDEEDWMLDAACRPASIDPRIFFPRTNGELEIAQVICEACPVQQRCLAYALTNRIDHGVWGGESERSRRRILKALAQQALRNKSTRRPPGTQT